MRGTGKGAEIPTPHFSIPAEQPEHRVPSVLQSTDCGCAAEARMRNEKDVATAWNMLKTEREERTSVLSRDGFAETQSGRGRPSHRGSNVRRLRRIEDQIRGLQRMVEEDRYCPDIRTQVSSAREALTAMARSLMRNHLTLCCSATPTRSVEQREAMYDELTGMILQERSIAKAMNRSQLRAFSGETQCGLT